MEWTGLNDLRKQFLNFFAERGHFTLESAPLIPAEDKSLLLINSGMAPLKKYFLGQAKLPGNRAVSCQKCIRTPDIERVGKTARHGTYFEMLGNFSFADYFKREAIGWAWELCTEVWKLPKDRLYCSVFFEDDEAWDIWTKEIGVAENRMVRLGREDNFWEIGAGPCGPCSEIYFDRGEQRGCGREDCAPGCDCDRFVEFWNLVFTQFISDGNGSYQRMEHGNIDTGMGLERIACIMQGVDNLFEVDTVQNIMRHIERISGVEYHSDEKKDVSLRVITDHIRSTVFMVGDGVGPSNEGRGYVLRRLLRRAARHGRLLGITDPFLYQVSGTVIDENVGAYPYLEERRDFIRRVIKAEEERFLKTIDQGFSLLMELIGQAEQAGIDQIDGRSVFQLYDTFGFPLDLTEEILGERGFSAERAVFEDLMEEQRRRAREERKSRDEIGWEEDFFTGLDFEKTEFVGYETLRSESVLQSVATGEGRVLSASEGERVTLLLDKTPFYAESGGQVGDIGTVRTKTAAVNITGCKKNAEGYYLHSGTVEHGVIEAGEAVTAAVDTDTRAAVMRNHTGAHLLQQALRQILGEHVHQSGSYVDGDRLRFDFTHFEALTPETIGAVERLVNEKILQDLPVTVGVMPIGEAKQLGAMALFGEKYGDTVRVVQIKDFSAEFCGGTHITNTAKLGLFKILSESSVAAGVRRIEAATGFGVMRYIADGEELLRETARALKLNSTPEIPKRAAALAEQLKAKEKEIRRLQEARAGSAAGDALETGEDVDGLSVRMARMDGLDASALRNAADSYKGNIPNSVTVIAALTDGKISFVAACGKDAVARGLNAGALVKEIALLAGGSGGGRPDIAMAGGKDETKLDAAVKAVPGTVLAMLQHQKK